MKRIAWGIFAATITACGGTGFLVNQLPVVVIGPDLTVAPNTDVTLDGSLSMDPDGEITAYEWNFGDGTTAQGPVVTHAWSEEQVYAVTLTVRDSRNGTASGAIRVTVSSGRNQQPMVVIDGPSRGAPGASLMFDGSMTSDPDGTVVAMNWDFGDGGTATGSTAAHIFSGEATYVVTLVAEDDKGGIGQATRSVEITTEAQNMPPTAVAGPPTLDAQVGVAVMFDGTASVDPDGSVVAYAWDFGDGNTASTPRASHSYVAAGTYDATLTVTDDGGATGRAAVRVTVAPPPSFDGTWVLNPDMSTITCDNTRSPYIVAFPTPRLMIMGTSGATVTAQVVNSGRILTGSVDRNTSPPEIQLDWTGTTGDTGANYPAGCGAGRVRHSFHAELPADNRMAQGRLTAIHDNWSGADATFCICTKSFSFTGGRQ